MSDGSGEAGKWPTADSLPGWEWTNFAEVFDNVTSSDLKLKQKEYAEEGALPVVDQGQEIIGGYTDQDELKHSSELPVVLFGDHTQCVKYLDFPFVQGADGTKVLKPTECVESRFAYWSMRTIDLPKKGYSRHFKFLRDSKFPIPPLAEQRRIVSKIESLQERSSRARHALSEVGPLLEQFRQSVLSTAFSGRLTADWRAANPDVEPATELLQRTRTERCERWEQSELAKYEAKGKQPPKNWQDKYKEPEPVDRASLATLPDLPESWCWITLDEANHRVTDGEHITPPRTKSGVMLLSARNVRDGQLSFDNVDYVSQETYTKIAERICVVEGDVLLSCSGTVGRSCVVPPRPNYTFVRSVAILKPVVSMGNFISLAIRSPLLQSQIEARKTQTAQSNIFQGRIKQLVMPLPPSDEQAEIVRIADDAIRAGEANGRDVDNAIDDLTQLNQSILAKAFRGELVPQDPNDEPASVLLDRIRTEREASQNGIGKQNRARARKK